jgi:hypothetical protein
MNNIQSRLGEITIVLIAIMWMLAIDETLRIAIAIYTSAILLIEELGRIIEEKKVRP